MSNTARKGQVSGVAVAVVGFAVVIVIGLFIIANIQNTLSLEGISTATQTKINDTFTTSYDSLKLLSVAIIVLAASAIIGIVAGLGGRQ